MGLADAASAASGVVINTGGIDEGEGGGMAVKLPDELPVLPLRGLVVFPGTIIPIGVGRPSSRRMLDDSLPHHKLIALFAQRDEEQEEPGVDGLHTIGTAAMVLKLVRQPDETVTLIVHGIGRIRLDDITQRDPYLRAKVSRVIETVGHGEQFDAIIAQLRAQADDLIEATPNTPDQARQVLRNITDPSNLADFLAANVDVELELKQALLEETDIGKRAARVLQLVTQQLDLAQLQQKIQQDVRTSIGEGQRRLFLREQMKAIREELGDREDGGEAVDQLRQRLEEADPPEEVMHEALRELDRLEVIPPASPEYSVITNYVELIAELPWNRQSQEHLNLAKARQVLDRDHFDLDKVKKRLLEFLAVRKLNPSGRSPILCLVGPPGVGKTSLGESVADALNRKFARLSLGGIRDEAEIRGHRRTYIGSMPGRLIQELRRAGTNNPVMMLDELDKLGSDFRGDPSSALLEVLDPRQNNKFVDRYLDVPFDLSNVLFICTANYFGNVPPPLRDRLETIEVPGYTDNDKLEIAKKYLVPRQLKEHGLRRKDCKFRVGGLKKIINDYTREAGVRELDRQVGAVCRGVAARIAAGIDELPEDAPPQATKGNGEPADDGDNKPTGGITAEQRASIKPTIVDEKIVREMLGAERHARDLDTAVDMPGLVLGLAYTSVGGEILFIEATSYPGKGRVQLTGQIGDVMKESATAAMSLFKSRADKLGFDINIFKETDVHIHVPAGAVPKDGPSAGVAMFTAITSLMLEKPVHQKLAMTGEITLRGRVLPIGGVKEKTLAAARAGIKKVILPKTNERDMEEVDPKVAKQLDFAFVENVDQLLHEALGLQL